MEKDLTKGNPTKLILAFSVPLLIGNIFQQFYSMVDTVIVGQYVGMESLAGVGSTGGMSFMVIGFVTGITSGFSVITAQRFGAKDEDGMRKSVAVSILLSIIFTILLTAVSVITARPLLELLGTPDNIIKDAETYITIIFAGTGAVVFYNMISCILRALGDSKTPLYFLIVSSLLNVVLDLFLIVNLGMGVAGAGYATVISQVIAGILCFVYTLKRYPSLHLKASDWKFSFSFVMKHLTIGLPMAFQFSITAVGVLVVQSALNKFGAAKIAAYTAASKVEQLVIQPSATFGVTMATYCGQNLGAGHIDRIKTGVNKCLILSMIFNAVAAVIIVLFGGSLTQLFVEGNQPEVIAASRQYLNTVALFFFFLGALFIYRNALQGIGEAVVPLLGGVAEFVIRIGVAFTFPTMLGLGYNGICLASPLAWVGAAVPLGIYYGYRMKKLMKTYHPNLETNRETATANQ